MRLHLKKKMMKAFHLSLWVIVAAQLDPSIFPHPLETQATIIDQ